MTHRYAYAGGEHIRFPDLPGDPASPIPGFRNAASRMQGCVWVAILDHDALRAKRKRRKSQSDHVGQPVYLSRLRTVLDVTIALRGGDSYRIEAIVRAHDLHGDRRLAMFALVQGEWHRYSTTWEPMLSRIHWRSP